MLDILEAPFPFLVGVRADTFWERYKRALGARALRTLPLSFVSFPVRGFSVFFCCLFGFLSGRWLENAHMGRRTRL
jgi:hypothetical protein